MSYDFANKKTHLITRNISRKSTDFLEKFTLKNAVNQRLTAFSREDRIASALARSGDPNGEAQTRRIWPYRALVISALRAFEQARRAALEMTKPPPKVEAMLFLSVGKTGFTRVMYLPKYHQVVAGGLYGHRLYHNLWKN